MQQATAISLRPSKPQTLASWRSDKNRRDSAQSTLKILQPKHQKLKHPQIQVELVVHPKEKYYACPP